MCIGNNYKAVVTNTVLFGVYAENILPICKLINKCKKTIKYLLKGGCGCTPLAIVIDGEKYKATYSSK